jgi:hypothetical protein
MTYEDTMKGLIFLSGTLRMAAAIAMVMAAHDIIRNGLFVNRVGKFPRLMLYFCIISLCGSAFVAAIRMGDYPYSQLARELSHELVSINIILISMLVLATKTVRHTDPNSGVREVDYVVELVIPGR